MKFEYDYNAIGSIQLALLKYHRESIAWKLRHVLIPVIGELLFYKYDMKVDRCGSKIIFFTTQGFKRRDHVDTYNKIKSTSPAYDSMELIRKRAFNLNIKKIFLFIRCLFWRKFSGRGLVVKLVYIHSALKVYNLEKLLLPIPLDTYNLAAVYYDCDSYSSVFVQYANCIGCETVTMQHGQMISGLDNVSYEFEGLELKKSCAKYFLAWNEFTRQEAIISGRSPDSIIVAGIPKFIGMDRLKYIKKTKLSSFGVVLDRIDSEFRNEQNIQLIRLANSVAKHKNIKYYIKYHPASTGKEYNAEIEDNYCESVLPIDSSLEEYLSLVDYTIMSMSSMYIEFIFLRHPVFRLCSSEFDKYAKIKENTFNTPEEILEAVSKGIPDVSNELFRYLCCTENPEENYRAFFEQFV